MRVETNLAMQETQTGPQRDVEHPLHSPAELVGLSAVASRATAEPEAHRSV
jgi:hypothetical protein